jgi:hypothetical protein
MRPQPNMFSTTPVEMCTAEQLKKAVEELKGIAIELDKSRTHGGPMCNGSRFAQEFGFQLRGLRDHLLDGPQAVSADRAENYSRSESIRTKS